MEQEFHRIKRLPPYVFAEVNALKAEARARGEDIIDFGMGNPDQPPPPHVVTKLVETINDPRAHRYSTSRGIPGLRKAVVAYYGRRFGVDLDPEREIIVTLGSKEGLANLAQAITSPGDFDLMEQLERAVRHSSPKPLAVVLNHPANPTAETVGLDFYQAVVDFCRHHGIYVISDLAYAEVYFDDRPPPSILQVPGAREIAVEFTSLSKTYSMPGWRVGFCSGNAKLIAALARVKSYVDYGAFTPVQVAATAALNGPQDCVEEMRQRYKSRRDVLIAGLAAAGWQVPCPPATMFAWAPVPPAFAAAGSLEFSKLLLKEAKVAVSPGVGFGEYGEGHLRLALVENEQRIRQALRNIKAFLKTAGVAPGADPDAAGARKLAS